MADTPDVKLMNTETHWKGKSPPKVSGRIPASPLEPEVTKWQLLILHQ